MSKVRLNIQVRIALMAAILCVTSQWAIPIGPMVMTMQPFFVALCGAVLGGVPGVLCVLIYLLIGALGVPVFSGFRAGFAHFAGSTGGYLWGFLILALGCGLLGKKGIYTQLLSALAALVLMYAVGHVQFMWVANLSFTAALGIMTPFFLKDLVVVPLAVILGRAMKRRLPNA